MIFLIIFIPLIGISGFITLFSFYSLKNNIVFVIFKGFTTLLIALLCSGAYFLYGTMHSPYFLYITLIFLGLIFSLAGDIIIFFKKNPFFLIALASFACTHIAYAISFLFYSQFSLMDIGTSIVIISIGLIIYFYFSRHLKKLKIPVIFYLVIISFMAWRAVSTLFGHRLTLIQGLFIAGGSILFYISDIILGMNMFVKPIRKFHLKNLSLYYCGQLFIALSCYFFTTV
ncbi:MAG: lysoplasmalogenase [Spirochaetales bacterium]|nr:lysoplasmalogenase [Spirochaetales bacterium]